MGKVTTSRAKKQRHDPLVKDLKEAEGRLKKVRKDEGDDNTNGEEFIDDKASRKILQLAKAQQEEIEEENEKESQDAKFQNARFKVITYDNDDEEEEEEEEDFGENISDFEPEEGEYVEEEEVVEIDEEDAAMFEQYFKKADDFNSVMVVTTWLIRSWHPSERKKWNCRTKAWMKMIMKADSQSLLLGYKKVLNYQRRLSEHTPPSVQS